MLEEEYRKTRFCLLFFCLKKLGNSRIFPLVVYLFSFFLFIFLFFISVDLCLKAKAFVGIERQ